MGVTFFAFYIGWESVLYVEQWIIAKLAWALEGRSHLIDEISLIPGNPKGAIPLMVEVGLWVVAFFTLYSAIFSNLRRQKKAIEKLIGGLRAERVDRSTPLGELISEVESRVYDRSRIKYWLIPTDGLIAFAISIGFGRCSIVLSNGIIKHLDPDALSFVIAHEIAHIYYKDTASSGLWLAVQRSAITFIKLRFNAFRILVTILARLPISPALTIKPILFIRRLLLWSARLGLAVGRLIFKVTDRWVSRHMEYRADEFAGQLIGYNIGMRALSRLGGDAEPLFNGLFATHPPISKRIERLRSFNQQTPDQE